MTESSRDQWNAAAAVYDDVAGTERDIVYANLKADLWDLLGSLDGKAVLDLGCGSGWLAALMTARGAIVTGVDGSQTLLDLARERYPDGTWILHDLRQGLPGAGEYDLVVSNMVLMDFDPIEPVISDVSRQLRAGGRMIVTLTHPAFFNYQMDTDGQGIYRKVRNYLASETWHIATYGGHTHFHRPLSDYTNVFGRHGLLLKQLREPPYKGNIPGFCIMEFSLTSMSG